MVSAVHSLSRYTSGEGKHRYPDPPRRVALGEHGDKGEYAGCVSGGHRLIVSSGIAEWTEGSWTLSSKGSGPGDHSLEERGIELCKYIGFNAYCSRAHIRFVTSNQPAKSD